MHVYYKFGLLLIFILSISTSYTRAAPATNQSSFYDDYADDYNDDYYDENEGGETVVDKAAHRTVNRTVIITATTTTTAKPLFPLFTLLDLPSRSNHVIEPICPKQCICQEDFKYIQCSHSRLTHVPQNLPNTALIIDLSYNKINILRPNDFENCTKVLEINLNYNEIATIEKETFQGLKRLQRLYLANNHFTHLQPNAFSEAIDLSSLNLSNNTLSLNSKGSFLHQPGLLELLCRNCSWTQLYDETFANMSALTTLKLDQNDFNKKINTKAFSPLKNLIKLKLPELDQPTIQELCNLLKSIDNISFKHFDISCFELVLGTSFNESLILATDPPYKPPPSLPAPKQTSSANSEGQQKSLRTEKQKSDMTEKSVSPTNFTTRLEIGSIDSGDNNTVTENVLTAGFGSSAVNTIQAAADGEEKPYQVPISQEAINYMLISIMIIAVIGLIMGFICRKDVGGIKTKCCRTHKPEPKDEVHPTEEIPLNKLS